MKTEKLVTIALDAFDSALVRRWVSEGSLPTISRLLASGVSSTVRTPPGVLEGGVWPTLLTGLSPASHGMFTGSKITPGSYELKEALMADNLPTPFWMELSAAGKKVAIVDAPFARPLKLNGMQMTNWGAHDPWCWERSSWPSDLLDDIVRRFGDHPATVCEGKRRSLKDYWYFRSQLLQGVRKKTEVLRYFLKKEDWDFFFGVYSESHCVGHNFWHFMDAGHPRHDPSASAELQSAIRDVYVAIDHGLGEVLTDVPGETNVVMVLSHGMAAYYHGTFFIKRILERLGVNEVANPGWSSPEAEAAAHY